MNFLTLLVSDKGMRFSGGDLDGQAFEKGDAVFIQEDRVWFGKTIPPIESLECGFWMLCSTIHRGHPTVICSYYNKRTQQIDERYFKVLYYEGLYKCGPRFPRLIERFKRKRSRHCDRWKEAA